MLFLTIQFGPDLTFTLSLVWTEGVTVATVTFKRTLCVFASVFTDVVLAFIDI